MSIIIGTEPLIPFEPKRTDQIPDGKEWVYQVKWDGVRILAYGELGTVKLYNRKKRERTLHYPEITTKSFIEADSFIVDGEVIALAADGKPSFHEVMRRDGLRRMERVGQVMKEVPIYYMVFDLLYLDGEWITQKPMKERIQLLQERFRPSQYIQLVSSETNGAALYKAIEHKDMEGIVCKKLDSTYGIGKKDERWVKVKNYGDVIAVAGGYTLNGQTANALLLGLYDDEQQLHFIGKVGTGKLTNAEWNELTTHLKKITVPISPFHTMHADMKGAHWVKPTLTIKVQYSEWRRHEGRVLRQPSIQQFVDVPPLDCKFE